MSNGSSGRSSSESRTEDVQAKIDSIQREFNRLEEKADLANVQETIGRIEERLAEYPLELSSFEQRGYVHSGKLHGRLDMLNGQWRKIRPGLRSALREQQNKLKSEVRSTLRLVSQARSGRKSAISSAENAVDRLETKLGTADRTLSSQYRNVDSELSGLGYSLKRVSWMLDQLDESQEISLRSGEGPLLAVKSEWHRDGDDGPKGVIFLTDQRLLFEQKEEVVTKRRFGIFKSESEIVHKLWLDINVKDIESVEDSEEGGFLGIGKDDILEIVCSGDAPVSRARFHLDGQDSSDWRTEIKEVQTGVVASELHEAARAEQASQVVSFPSQCPNCMAPLPEPHRGSTYLKCEFCGTSVGPEISG